MLGVMGILSTLVALIVASFVPGGIVIRGLEGWVGGALVVWITTALGSWLLPFFFIRDKKHPKETQDPSGNV